MEYESSVSEFTDSNFTDNTDSFVSSNDDHVEELTWNSDDSRPPGPSPPSSTVTSEPENAGVGLRRVTRRRIYVEPDTESDEGSITVSQVSTVSESNPPSPTVSTFMIHENTDSQFETDSDMTAMPTSPPDSPPSSVVSVSSGEDNLIPRSPEYSPPPSPDLPAPQEPGPTVTPEPVIPPVANEVAAAAQEVSEPAPQNDHLASNAQNAPLQIAVPASAPLPAPALNSSCLSDIEDNSLCSICMDPLTNSGKHRVVCLRCGHIFGKSCLERWISVGCNNGAKRCPTCNKKACLKDIRILYLPKVVPLDTVERDRLIQEKEELIAQKNVLEMELSKCKLQQQLSVKKCEEKLAKLEKDLFDAKYKLKIVMEGKAVPDVNGVKLKKEVTRAELVHSIDLTKEGGCRVLAYSPILHELVVSQPSGNTLFAGFGVRVLNSVDFQPTRYVYLHSKMIRDLAFHPEDKDLLLSVSLDQTAKLVDLGSSTTVHTFKGEGPLWSCCWDVSNPHLMLVGSQVGKVCQYDRRMTDNYVSMWTTANNMTPVVSLASVSSDAQTPFPQGGFLSCRLNGVFAYARHGTMHNCQELPLSGPFMSMRYDRVSQNLLTSARPSSACPYVRISLNLLDVDKKGHMCLPEIHTFNCGLSARVLSRVTTVPTVNDSIIVAHHESGRTMNLWSSKTGNLVQSIPIREPVIDLSNMCFNNNKCLFASLSEKTVCIYKIT